MNFPKSLQVRKGNRRRPGFLPCAGPWNGGCGAFYPNCAKTVIYHGTGGSVERNTREHFYVHNHSGDCTPEV